MSYLVLARKYRPANFSEVVGQEGVVRTLKNAIEMERVAHAYLFTGARGVGKTTVARLLAKALNCERGPTPEPDNDCSLCTEIAAGISPDVFEIDGASNTGVDDVRQLRDNSQYMPARSRFKIYIIDEVHMLSTSAFNALLKTLEEPPAHVKFIFATTEPHKIPLTVLSRCQRFDFKRIPSAAIVGHLENVLSQEGMSIDSDGLRVIARQAAGSMRDALSLTDQVLAFGGERIEVAQVRDALGLTGSAVYDSVIEAILDGQADALMRHVERLFDEGHDLKRFLDGLLWHVHYLSLFRTLHQPGELVDLIPEERQRMGQLAQRADPLRWHQIFDVLSRTVAELSRSPHPRLVVETALLRLSVIEPVVAIDDLLQRVEQLASRVGGSGPGGSGSGGGGSGQPRRFQPPARSPSQPARAERRTAPAQGAEADASPPPAARPKPEFDHPNAPGAEEPPPPQGPQEANPPEPASPKAAPVAQKPEPEPSPEAAPEPEPAPAAPAPGVGLDGPQAWEALVNYINKHRPSLGSFLSHGAPREVRAGLLVVAFEKGSFFADQVRAKRNTKDLELSCAEFFGSPTQVRIENLAQDDTPSLAKAREQANREEEDEKRRQAVEHPMVQEAIRVFGAEVDHIKTNPGKGR